MGDYVVYRHFNCEGDLLYVGMTSNVCARNLQHKNISHWFSQVSKITLDWFSEKKEAKDAEASAICSENPKYNKNLKHGVNKKVCIVSLNDHQHSVMAQAAKLMGMDIPTYIRSCGLLAINEASTHG